MKAASRLRVAAITLCTAWVGANAAAAPGSPTNADTTAAVGIAWQPAASDADVDAAFAQARSERKPVFVYWGAKWCPPCNQVKATLFNRQDFIERTRAFVAVYVDGDSPGAQKLGTRFKVRGYPTMVLFSPQGDEVTRLPGEVDAATVTQVLTLGINAQRPVKQVLAQALSGPKGAKAMTANDWKLLAFYSWETDEQQLVPKVDVPALLGKLADACPAALREPATRLRLKALAAAGATAGAAATSASATAAASAKSAVTPAPAPIRARVLQVLADPAQSRAHMDVLTNNAAELVAALAGVTDRAALVSAFDSSLKRLQADTSLSRADRLTALYARVDLALPVPGNAGAPAKPATPAAAPVLPPALLAEVRDAATRADRDTKDAYERQAVVTSAADLLNHAGLGADSDALLQANLARSHSPYYLMSGLAQNARERGDNAAALRWSQQAFDAAKGPATRLQWGAAYVGLLVDLAPGDDARIERTARQLFAEAAKQPDAFFERSGRSLQRVATKLSAWNAGADSGRHAAAFGRVRADANALCSKQPAADAQRARCEALFKAPVAAASAS